MRRWVSFFAILLTAASVLRAQDTTRTPEGVRVGIEYRPGERPSIVVLPAPGRDSVRAILLRDLDYSDRFDVIPLGNEGASATVNYVLLRSMGAEFGVEIADVPGATAVRLHDMKAGSVRKEQKFNIPAPNAGDFRMAVHRIADEIVRWVTGTPGIAASQVVYVLDKHAYRVDSDGANVTQITSATDEVLSPVWSPDGRKLAFTKFGAGAGSIIVLDVASGQRTVLTTTDRALNFTPSFGPDSRTLAFARATEEGTDIYTADVAANCCVQRLTVGRYSDNLSPTYAPDGRRMAFVSTRAGLPQIYVMAADGTDQELLAPFDYGVTGSSNAPDWSPDGAGVVFHRDVALSPQIFVLDVASHKVRQLTSAGRNEDPAWAPDGRHIVFVSDRSSRRQLWVIDTVTGRVRQLTFTGQVRLPAWSRRL
jgi:TolB protein